MYLPPYASAKDEAAVRDLIGQNAFATVLSFPSGEQPFINHLPIVFSGLEGEENVLVGHMAKRNPQWRHFEANPQATMIFHGPHTYITPTWYKSGRDVPTWNYAVVHLHGRIELLPNFKDQIAVLQRQTAVFEAGSANPWEFELPSDLLDAPSLESAIISFKFHIEKQEVKFKLSQNRSELDQQGVIDGLSTRTDDDSRAIRELMKMNRR